jgi:hypothetical protein
VFPVEDLGNSEGSFEMDELSELFPVLLKKKKNWARISPFKVTG